MNIWYLHWILLLKDDSSLFLDLPLDYSKVNLTSQTVYETVYPQVDELEFFIPPKPGKTYPITLGEVLFGLSFDFEAEQLEVTIYEAKNLPAADEGEFVFVLHSPRLYHYTPTFHIATAFETQVPIQTNIIFININCFFHH